MRWMLGLGGVVGCGSEPVVDEVVEPRGPGCEDAGYDATPFDATASGWAIGEPVEDVELTTLDGTWRLSEGWGDCSMVTLVPYTENFATDPVDNLVGRSELNNTYVFFSRETGRRAALSALRDRIEAELADRSARFAETWRPKFQFVVDDPSSVPLLDLLGTFQTDYFLIDSRQRLRDAGSYRSFDGDFIPELEMIRYGARWFNYERGLEERLASEDSDPDVLVVPWLTEGYVETDDGVHPIALPPAADLERYDRMEIVVKETCEPGSRFPVHFGVCPAWDVGHKVTLCDDAESCVSSEKQQLYRYVTGYHSGVWLTEDVTHGLPFFKRGGQQFLRTDRRDFFGTIEFRFYDDGDVAPEDDIEEAIHLVDMGRAQFDPAHNDSIPSYRFTPPPGTVRVVMDARVQGGGNQSGTGCAEFCSHEHRIDVNGIQWDTVFEMESVDACARRSRQGVTAGQFGTWFIDRGSWCPGGPVERWREDITEAVDLDGLNTITWTSSFEGDDWPPSGGLTATVWLAFYGGDGAPIIERLPVETCPNPPTVTVRDFSKDHPDFEPLRTAWAALEDGDAAKEAARGELTGAVAPTLEEVDGHLAPRLVWPENTLPYTTAASFDDWWRDAPSNQVVPLAGETGRRTRQDTWGYFRSNADASVEWPLIAPTAGFGAEGVENGHEGGTPVNTSFTVEVAGPFTHREGLDLRIGSRADLWVFLDGELIYENAGFLGKGLDKNVLSLDAFDLVAGQTYDLRIFAVVGRGGESNPTLWLEHPACL